MHTVRRALPNDAAAIGELVRGLVGDSLTDPNGDEAERFFKTLAPEEMARFMSLPSRFYAVAEVDRVVLGMIMVRDANYVSQFFVHPDQQRRGIGSSLWRFALASSIAAGGSGEFTVRSSLAAEPVYRRFGFLPTGPVETKQGFRFIPMLKARESAA